MRSPSRRTYWPVAVLLLLLIAAALFFAPVRDATYKALYPVKYSELVERYSEQNGLPESLVYAVIKNESSFRPDAVSSIGARGLMQMTEDTFDWVRGKIDGDEEFDDLFDPETSIAYGTSLLSMLIQEFGSAETALCAYHAGWGSVKGWLTNEDYSVDGESISYIPFADTRSYVEKVLQTVSMYQEIYGLS